MTVSEARAGHTPFLDWYDIWAGLAGNENGENWLQDPPVGVHLAVQQAQRSEIFLRAESHWEQGGMNYPQILLDDGLYRLWYWTTGAAKGAFRLHAYAESRDGFEWERPELGMVEYEGSSENNLIFRYDDFELNSVFIDPNARPEERYKAISPRTIFFRDGVADPEIGWPEFRELAAQTDAADDSTKNSMEAVRAKFGVWRDNVVLGAVSPDGLRWRILDEPLVNVGGTPLDTHNIAAYEPESGEYVAYLRGFPEELQHGFRGRRAVRKVAGKQFGNWSAPRYVLMADNQDRCDDDIYTSAYCRYPGVAGLHLMFPAIYHRMDSELDVQLAVSRDGWNWSRPERKPIITRDAEDGEYGMVIAGPSLVPLNEREWGLPYACMYDRHDRGPKDEGARDVFRWAIWERDRLAALEAPVEGRVTTIGRQCHGGELRLNFQTRKAGWIKVELTTQPTEPVSKVEPIEGFSLAEADPLSGDELDQVVTWKGNGDLSRLQGMKVAVRIHMARAKLFSFSI